MIVLQSINQMRFLGFFPFLWAVISSYSRYLKVPMSSYVRYEYGWYVRMKAAVPYLPTLGTSFVQ